MQEFVSAVIEWGSYPFPSRTRKSSPTSPMVPGPRIRESRSPLDSRPPRGKPPGGLFFVHRSALRLHSRDHDSSIRVACRSRAPCQDGWGPLRFYAQPLAPMSCRDSVEALALAITAGRYRPHLARSPHEVNPRGGPFFFCTRAHPGIAVHGTRPRHPERSDI